MVSASSKSLWRGAADMRGALFAAILLGAGTAPVAQAQQQAPEELQSLPPVQQQSLEAATEAGRDAAFDAAVESILPLRPAEIRELLRRLNESQEAAADPPDGIPPQPATRVQPMSLDPGHIPPVINTSSGYVTTLSILDASGQPWPIFDVAFAGDFQVPTPEENSHTLRITPLSRHGTGNLSIRLIDLATPITFRMETGNRMVDYRVDARVPRLGPNGQVPLIERAGSLSAGDGVLLAVLDGVPPDGAERLEVRGVDRSTSAYRIGDRLYLRTPMQLLSPGWDHSVASADGTQVYALNNAPVLLLSDNGVMVRAHVAPKETLP